MESAEPEQHGFDLTHPLGSADNLIWARSAISDRKQWQASDRPTGKRSASVGVDVRRTLLTDESDQVPHH
jgi:hypothetical protein